MTLTSSGFVRCQLTTPYRDATTNQNAISHSTFIDAVDANGVRLQDSVLRDVKRSNRATEPLQILGLHTCDPLVVERSTSLGPSRAIVDARVKEGSCAYSFGNFVRHPLVSGTLVRDEKGPIAFPALINGRRVETVRDCAVAERSTLPVTPTSTQVIQSWRYL